MAIFRILFEEIIGFLLPLLFCANNNIIFQL
jgi:hypothetical protein